MNCSECGKRHGTDILAIIDDIMTLHVCVIFKENLETKKNVHSTIKIHQNMYAPTLLPNRNIKWTIIACKRKLFFFPDTRMNWHIYMLALQQQQQNKKHFQQNTTV